jgi:hypothetical protein
MSGPAHVAQRDQGAVGLRDAAVALVPRVVVALVVATLLAGAFVCSARAAFAQSPGHSVRPVSRVDTADSAPISDNFFEAKVVQYLLSDLPPAAELVVSGNGLNSSRTLSALVQDVDTTVVPSRNALPPKSRGNQLLDLAILIGFFAAPAGAVVWVGILAVVLKLLPERVAQHGGGVLGAGCVVILAIPVVVLVMALAAGVSAEPETRSIWFDNATRDRRIVRVDDRLFDLGPRQRTEVEVTPGMHALTIDDAEGGRRTVMELEVPAYNPTSPTYLVYNVDGANAYHYESALYEQRR